MRDRLPLVGAWLLVTVLATVVGLAAVGTVGIVLRGAGPLGEQFSSVLVEDAAGPVVGSGAREAVLSHPGAVLRARCAGRIATLLDVRLAAGVAEDGSDLGPDEDVHVDLVGSTGPVRLEVYCNSGTPRLVTE